MKIRVAYIVLHYQALNETIGCVESIKRKHGDGDALIVVIDNASPNGTGKNLNEIYNEDTNVKVILNKENLGFANGLNTGIKYLRENSFDGLIVLLNNDTELQTDGWDNLLIKKYEEYKFAALGPDIISLGGKIHSNPSRKQDISPEGIRKLIRRKKIDYFKDLIYIRPIELYLRNLIKRAIKYKKESKLINADTLNVQLQGSCLILSPIYFEYYEGLYPGTFLYFEEAILRYRCEKNNIICMYSPELKLIHKGSVSIDGTFNSKRKKEMFYLKQSMSSCKRFLDDVVTGNE